MKNFHNLITSLQKNITENKATALVAYSIFNQQILYSLQVNGYIDGFNILNPRQILVYFKIRSGNNVIKRIFKYKRSDRFKFNAAKWYNQVGFTHFTILMTRHGLLTNKEVLLLNTSGIPLLGIL